MGENGRVRRRALTLILLLAVVSLTAAACKTSGSPGAGQGATATGGAAVPAVAGKRLSAAESELSAAGFHDVKAVDATGQNRVVVNPENWIVQSQDPAAGARIDHKTRITLKVRKPSDGAGGGGTAAGV